MDMLHHSLMIISNAYAEFYLNPRTQALASQLSSHLSPGVCSLAECLPTQAHKPWLCCTPKLAPKHTLAEMALMLTGSQDRCTPQDPVYHRIAVYQIKPDLLWICIAPIPLVVLVQKVAVSSK
jgi:hypothetical protein